MATQPQSPKRAGVEPVSAGSSRDLLWEHCRNSLGTARLLVHEGRPERLISTACLMAVESGCRAALEDLGTGYDGNLRRNLRRGLGVLQAPAGLLAALDFGAGRERLAATERAVGWLSARLKERAPERSWGF
jgi:hypothetical protein